MILAIAIISLVGFLGGIIYDIIIETKANPNPRGCLCAVMVLSWWIVNFPTALVLLVFAAFWVCITLLAWWDDL